jgi:hypothetical protein
MSRQNARSAPTGWIAAAYRRLASGRIALAAGNLVILFLIVFNVTGTAPPAGAPTPLALQLAFTKSGFRDVLDRWGPDAVASYRDWLLLDYFFPLVYAIFLSSAVATLSTRRGEAPDAVKRALFVAPLLAVPFDYLENTLHLVLLSHTGHLAAGLILLASVAAAIKWGLIACAGAGIAYWFVRRLSESQRVA